MVGLGSAIRDTRDGSTSVRRNRMAYLGDTPHLETASPFATPPTVIQTSVTEVKRAVLNGIGAAIGMTLAGYVFVKILGIRRLR